MDFTMLLPAIAVVAVLVFWVSYRRKQTAKNREVTEPKVTGGVSAAHKVPDVVKEVVQKPEAVVIPPVVIYEDSYRNMRICPFCDGENDRSAVCCVICGERL